MSASTKFEDCEILIKNFDASNMVFNTPKVEYDAFQLFKITYADTGRHPVIVFDNLNIQSMIRIRGSKFKSDMQYVDLPLYFTDPEHSNALEQVHQAAVNFLITNQSKIRKLSGLCPSKIREAFVNTINYPDEHTKTKNAFPYKTVQTSPDAFFGPDGVTRLTYDQIRHGIGFHAGIRVEQIHVLYGIDLRITVKLSLVQALVFKIHEAPKMLKPPPSLMEFLQSLPVKSEKKPEASVSEKLTEILESREHSQG